jgi:hypothetical protein
MWYMSRRVWWEKDEKARLLISRYINNPLNIQLLLWWCSVRGYKWGLMRNKGPETNAVVAAVSFIFSNKGGVFERLRKR